KHQRGDQQDEGNKHLLLLTDLGSALLVPLNAGTRLTVTHSRQPTAPSRCSAHVKSLRSVVAHAQQTAALTATTAPDHAEPPLPRGFHACEPHSPHRSAGATPSQPSVLSLRPAARTTLPESSTAGAVRVPLGGQRYDAAITPAIAPVVLPGRLFCSFDVACMA